MHKIVITRTLSESRWRNTELCTPDIAAEVNRLKSQQGKDIIMYGGSILFSSMMRAGLIDEFNLFINPAILGNGNPFFKDLGMLNLKLTSATDYPCGVVVTKYALK